MRAAPLLALLMLAGCDLSMSRQERHAAQSAPTLWPDGPDVQSAPDGAVAADDPARASALAQPPHVTPALLARGAERYGIYCAPCHGGSGAGDGIVVRRGFPAPPSLLGPGSEAASPAATADVITHGKGVMYDLSDRVPPADRWAIAAYVVALRRAGAER